MILHFFIPPVVFAAAPTLGKVQEQIEYANLHDDDDISLPSLGGLSIGSDLSCDELSHVELCHLLGKEIPQDAQKHSIPKDLAKPKNLEYATKIDLPVGYFRLRKAFLSDNNDFWDRNILNKTLKYKK